MGERKIKRKMEESQKDRDNGSGVEKNKMEE